MVDNFSDNIPMTLSGKTQQNEIAHELHVQFLIFQEVSTKNILKLSDLKNTRMRR